MSPSTEDTRPDTATTQDLSSDPLDGQELGALIERVFRPGPDERQLAILTDLPDQAVPDTRAWSERRRLAADWVEQLQGAGYACDLYLFRNVRANNADLPNEAWRYLGEHLPSTADDPLLEAGSRAGFQRLFSTYPVFLALTEFSATAPLKVAARRHGFRAATMPGFSSAMIPALRLDYEEIERRVSKLARLLDRATRADFLFAVEGQEMALTLDLRHRHGHASGGLVHSPGSAGNLPSGEAYIVPYEGEIAGDGSCSEGVLPVQFGDEVVRFRIEENRATEALGDGPNARHQAEYLAREPAYGNIAELGLGVLTDFGLRPIGQILLDEKLGLHIAFGRSDHFGGQVGPDRFSRPEEVVHIDHIYLPEIQPAVHVEKMDLVLEQEETLPLIRDRRYVIDFKQRNG